jgi:hypothetical protein
MSTRARTLRRIGRWAVLLLVALSLLGGCSSGKKGPSEAELKAQAEQRAKQAAEDAKQAEERRKAEEQRQLVELQEAFGPVGEPPAPPAALTAPGAAAGGTPFDEAVPPLPAEPTVRVAVLSHDAPLAKGRQVALLVGTYDRDRIEARLGRAVKIMYVAETTHPLARASEVHYRKNYLSAAETVAQTMPAQQWIAPMTPAEQSQPNVDVVIHIGKDYR